MSSGPTPICVAGRLDSSYTCQLQNRSVRIAECGGPAQPDTGTYADGRGDLPSRASATVAATAQCGQQGTDEQLRRPPRDSGDQPVGQASDGSQNDDRGGTRRVQSSSPCPSQHGPDVVESRAVLVGVVPAEDQLAAGAAPAPSLVRCSGHSHHGRRARVARLWSLLRSYRHAASRSAWPESVSRAGPPRGRRGSGRPRQAAGPRTGR
jgi:hypothetical protein